MVYADTSFFIAIMNETVEHHLDAMRIRKRFQDDLETSLLTIAELLKGCENHGLNPENIISSIFSISKVSGISFTEAMLAAHLMNERKLKAIDALHCALAGERIISADKDFDKTSIERVWS